MKNKVKKFEKVKSVPLKTYQKVITMTEGVYMHMCVVVVYTGMHTNNSMELRMTEPGGPVETGWWRPHQRKGRRLNKRKELSASGTGAA